MPDKDKQVREMIDALHVAMAQMGLKHVAIAVGFEIDPNVACTKRSTDTHDSDLALLIRGLDEFLDSRWEVLGDHNN